MAAHAKPGPRPLPGPRYDCGRRKPQGDPRGQVILQRIRHAAARIADPILSTPLGILIVAGEITDRQAEAAFLVQNTYAELDRLNGWRRSAKSGALERSSRSEDDDVVVAEEAKRAKRINDRLTKIGECFHVLPYPEGDQVGRLVGRLCVEQRAIARADLARVCPMLDYIGQVFNLQGAPSTPSIAISARRSRRQPPARAAAARQAPHDKTAFLLVARDMARMSGKDPTDFELEQAWRDMQMATSALRARERMRARRR